MLGLDLRLAALLGAVLVLLGPTVVGPLLRHLRVGGPVSAVLKWEGTVIDPIGAMLATLVFEWIGTDPAQQSAGAVARALLWTFGAGAVVGGLSAAVVVAAVAKHWVSDRTQAPVVLTVALLGFVGANALHDEAGLVAVTVMGFACANQRRVSFHHIAVFKEHLTQILIPCLFIVLASRLSLDALLLELNGRGLLFLLFLILVARPAAVFCSTFRSRTLGWKERVFLSSVFPRGIVAAAVVPLFAQRLAPTDPEAERLVALVILVIIGTVTFYGLGSVPIAARLGLRQADTHGLLILGASPVGRAIAEVLTANGVEVLLLDSNARAVTQGAQLPARGPSQRQRGRTDALRRSDRLR